MFLSYEEYVKQNYPEYYEIMYVKNKEFNFDEVSEQFNKCCYVCPCCGEEFKLDSKNECCGHGESYLSFWLKCECGIEIKRFFIFDEDSFNKFFAFIEKFKCKEDIE